MARAGTLGRICRAAATATAVFAALPGVAAAVPQAVYTQTNEPSGNAVAWFERSDDGKLTLRRTFPTGGRGAPNFFSMFPTTDSQGSVVINPRKTLLFAVNHGSRSVTSFRIQPDGALQRAAVVSSGGNGPSSLAINGDGILYVSNEGAPARLQGFRVSDTGDMTPIAGANTMLAHPKASPGQVGFDSSGKVLVVTARFAGATAADRDYFEVFRLGASGVLEAMPQVISVPQEPYAFGFTRRNEMLVANAENNAPLASTTSSYRVGPNGEFTRVASQPTSQTAACWLVIADNDRFAYVSNGGGPTVVAYSMSEGGLFQNVGGLIKLSGLGGDLATTPGSAFLYVLNTDPAGILMQDPDAFADVDAFRIGPDGQVKPIGTFGMGRLPFSTSGLAVL